MLNTASDLSWWCQWSICLFVGLPWNFHGAYLRLGILSGVLSKWSVILSLSSANPSQGHVAQSTVPWVSLLSSMLYVSPSIFIHLLEGHLPCLIFVCGKPTLSSRTRLSVYGFFHETFTKAVILWRNNLLIHINLHVPIFCILLSFIKGIMLDMKEVRCGGKIPN